MRNLKKALVLVLSLAMILSVMVMGVGAATFPDQDKIDAKHTNAVDMCVSLNIINGMADGSFDPQGNVTREQMAKMICILDNGGKEPQLSAGSTFSDVAADRWSNKYIESCAARGVVAGVGDGKFNPAGNVTATQAAKMLLVELGYDQDLAKYTGSNWATNVNIDATQKGYYDDLEDIDVSAPLSREHAAQMVWNALQAFEVEYKNTLVTDPATGALTSKVTVGDKQDNAGVKSSLLNDKYEALIWIGDFTGNYDTGDTGNNKGYIEVFGKLDTAPAATPKANATLPYDLDLLKYCGEEVKVVFKDANGGTRGRPDDKDTIYGVYVTGDTQVVNCVRNDIADDFNDGAKIKVDGTKYTVAAGATIHTNLNWALDNTPGVGTAFRDALAQQSNDTIKFILNDDGDISAAYVMDYAAAYVTAATSAKVSLSGVGSIELAENNNDVYTGIAKDDVVNYLKLYDNNKDDATFVVTKAETVEGAMTGYKINTAGQFANVAVDGTTYLVDSPAAALPQLVSDVADAVLVPGVDNSIKDQVCLYMINGMIAGIKNTDEGDTVYALVTDGVANGLITSTIDPWKVSLVTSDGKEATYVVHKDSERVAGTPLAAADITQAGTAPNLVKYTMSGDKVKIKEVYFDAPVTGTAAPGGQAKVWDKDIKKLVTDDAIWSDANGYSPVASDAVLYVSVGTDYYAYQLRNMKDIANTVAGVPVGYVLNDDHQVKAAYLDLAAKPGTASDTTVYGIISNVIGARVIGDDDYVAYTVSTADGDVTMNLEDPAGLGVAILAKGDAVYFDKSSDDCYALIDIDVVDGVGTGTAVAVKSFNTSSRLLTAYLDTGRPAPTAAYTSVNVESFTMDKEYKTVYIDKDNSKIGDNIGISAFDGTTGYANAYIVDKDGDDLYDVIYVETSGEVNLDPTNFGIGFTKVTLTCGEGTGADVVKVTDVNGNLAAADLVMQAGWAAPAGKAFAGFEDENGALVNAAYTFSGATATIHAVYV